MNFKCTVLQITFLEDVFIVTNILPLELHSDSKEFGAVRHALSTTLTTLNGMQNTSSIHLNSFPTYWNVLSQVESLAKYNIPEKHTRKS